jgi:hypothetical protein
VIDYNWLYIMWWIKNLGFLYWLKFFFFGHEILQYYVKFWINIHDYIILKHLKSFIKWKEKKTSYNFLNILYSLGSIQSIPHIFIIYYKGRHVNMLKSYNITIFFYQKNFLNHAFITFAVVHVNMIAPCYGYFSHAHFAKLTPNFFK